MAYIGISCCGISTAYFINARLKCWDGINNLFIFLSDSAPSQCRHARHTGSQNLNEFTRLTNIVPPNRWITPICGYMAADDYDHHAMVHLFDASCLSLVLLE